VWYNDHTALGFNLSDDILKVCWLDLLGKKKPGYLTFLSHYFSAYDDLEIFGFILFRFLSTPYRVMVGYRNAIQAAFPGNPDNQAAFPGNPDNLFRLKDAIVRIF